MSAMLDPPYDRPLATESLEGLIDALTVRREEIIEKGLHRIRTEIPEYRAIVDPAFVEDVRQHVALHHDALMRSVAARRPLAREELGFMRARATRRVGRIPLAAFMQAFRIYQEEFWDALLASADTEPARVSAMEAAGTIIRYINMAAAEAAEGATPAQAPKPESAKPETAKPPDGEAPPPATSPQPAPAPGTTPAPSSPAGRGRGGAGQ